MLPVPILRKTVTVVLILCASGLASSAAEPPTAAQLEFFETRIRPVLADTCYQCHNSAKKTDGGFAADDRESFLAGGDHGPVIVPGKPAESRLLAILRHEVDGLKMPQGLGKLEPRVIADFEKWITMGAPDPRDKPLSLDEIEQSTAWPAQLAKRKQWWSFQPIRATVPPDLPDNDWSDHPIDRFVLQKLRAQGLRPNAPADPEVLVRRLYFALIGLPPTGQDAAMYAKRLQEPHGYERLVDRLLERLQFGERWARHWMDWIRYAESHGSEGDPVIDNAWYFRDYLIRALNADVPYNQLVREHIAGDLLPQPRISPGASFNESAIGPVHWRMVFHGFAPTDALDEKVRFIDDEVNAFSKAFLGLTVSCARCHNHKFDPISQQDYYAIFGILNACRPSRVVIDTAQKLDSNRRQLEELKPQIRAVLVDEWLEALPKVRARLVAVDSFPKESASAGHILQPLSEVHTATKSGKSFADAWQQQVDAWKADQQQRAEHAARKYWRRFDLTSPAEYSNWFHVGNGLDGAPEPAGQFAVAVTGSTAVTGIYPSGVYSHLLSAKHSARLTSRDLRLDDNYELYVRAIGDGTSSARFVVQDYPRNGTVFPVEPLQNKWQWKRFDLSYWKGDPIHIELAAGKDAPLLVNNEIRSWFGVREVVIVKKGEPAPPSNSREHLDPLFEIAIKSPPTSLAEVADRYLEALKTALANWKSGSLSDSQASLLDSCLQAGVLPNELDQLPSTESLLDEYRNVEAGGVIPTRVPGIEETTGRQQPLFERGNHQQPGEIVPPRFLEAIDPKPYSATRSSRLQLADDLLRDDNPLTRRVIVNRLWHHLFGRGLVATPDNFGRLGQPPTHPELLDYLAHRFQEREWSIKDTIRFIVTSKTWQMSSQPSADALRLDPENLFLSHANLRRLEAEAIRDAILAVSSGMDYSLYGSPQDGSSARRSVYVRVTRNALDPFLRSFDFPEPFSTVGRRDVTNVPAQSLTLMNDERVSARALAWAGRTLADPTLSSDDARIQQMFEAGFSRPATAAEVIQTKDYLVQTRTRYEALATQVAGLRQQVEQRQVAIRQLIDPVRQRLVAEAKAKTESGAKTVLSPIHRWEFEGDLKDSVGEAHGQNRDGAKLEGGMLVVSPQAHVITAPLNQTLKAKTLEVWVQLDNLDQAGAGVMTVQTRDGETFDSIVFGEQSPRQWLAGSSYFERTQPFNGPQEQDAVNRPVHLAIAYYDDGRIAGYREGQPYGKPYKSRGPVEFKAGQTVVGFGIRHLPAGGNRMLKGRILRAQLYDRALSADEIQATFQSVPYLVSEAQILESLTAEQRTQITADRQRIRELEAEIDSLGTLPEKIDDRAIWTELARALFSFKEFIYVR